jgi:hypothetical protein
VCTPTSQKYGRPPPSRRRRARRRVSEDRLRRVVRPRDSEIEGHGENQTRVNFDLSRREQCGAASASDTYVYTFIIIIISVYVRLSGPS